MGPDDIPWLRMIPFQSQFQYIHFVPVPELFVVCLAAFGVYMCVVLVWEVADRGLRAIRAAEWQRLALLAVASGAIAFALVYSPCMERYKYGQVKSRNRKFEVTTAGQTEWSLRTPTHVGLKGAADYLRDTLGPFERFYGSPTDIHSGVEILHFTLMPGYTRRTNLISPLYGGLLGGINNMIHTVEFRRHLWKNPLMFDLLHVGSLITSVGNQSRYPFNEEHFRKQQKFQGWLVYDTALESLPFDVTLNKPVMFIGSARNWQEICSSWLRRVQKMEEKSQLESFPFVVWQRTSRRKEKNPVPLNRFSAIYVADTGLDPGDFFLDGELERFRSLDGLVFFQTTRECPDAPSWCSMYGATPKRFPFSKFVRAPKGNAKLGSITEAHGRHTVEVESDSECYLYFKSAFYRGWRVSVDGERTTNISVSPGFNGCRLEPGRHVVEFVYHGANNHVAGKLISLFTLVGFLGVPLVRRFRGRFSGSGWGNAAARKLRGGWQAVVRHLPEALPEAEEEPERPGARQAEESAPEPAPARNLAKRRAKRLKRKSRGKRKR
jgi:hypothetical protein